MVWEGRELLGILLGLFTNYLLLYSITFPSRKAAT
jgi:hypothetical protein